MLATERTVGSAYTRDADYMAFTGRVVRTTSTTYYDPKCKAWIKRTCEYIDVGRPDAVSPVDYDAELVEEHWKDEPERLVTVTAGKKSALVERERLLDERIQAHLRQHGATSVSDLARNVGIGQPQVINHLRKHTDKYVSLQGANPVWGLVGVDYGMDITLPQYVHLFRAALEKHGPMTIKELCRAAGVQRGSSTVGMARHTDIFARVGYSQRGRQQIAIWGLVGIHDQDIAA